MGGSPPLIIEQEVSSQDIRTQTDRTNRIITSSPPEEWRLSRAFLSLISSIDGLSNEIQDHISIIDRGESPRPPRNSPPAITN